MTDLGLVVAEPPSDGISNLRFADHSNALLASSWDGNVYVYDGATGARQTILHHGAPVLDADFDSEAAAVFSGATDHTVKRLDVATGQATTLGSHAAGVRCVEWLPQRGLLASAGWDGALCLWDPRAANPKIAHFSLPAKALSMSYSPSEQLVVATAGRQVAVYDLKTVLTAPGASPAPSQLRESALKFQTRCVRCYPNGEGFALSSVEGRVAMEYFEPSEAVQAKKYAFKCHRHAKEGKDVVYPVNAIAFNTKHGTFATGGCDGVVNFWDGTNKKRLHQVGGYPTSVAALSFNADATMLAVAASYTFEQGDVAHPADQIYLRPVNEVEVLPRQKQPKVVA